MKGNAMNLTSNLLVPSILGLLAAGLVYAALIGLNLPLISGPRPALIALLIVGMAMCSAGIGQVSASGRWASPLALLGYALGAAILLVIVAAFAGWKLPGISGDAQSVAAVALLMLVKLLIGTASYFLHLL